jgi:hypothetical protein
MKQHSIKIALRELENDRRQYDRRGGRQRLGWQEKMMIEAAIAAARRLASEQQPQRKVAS